MKTIVVFLITVMLASLTYAGSPVGRWDVVPDQRISSAFKVGVVAFHPEGLKVEFRVNGSLVHTANDPTYNDRTDVWEFWFSFDPSGYVDGPVTIDAKAVALNGTDPDYDLASLNMYANSGGSLTEPTVKWADANNGSDSNPGTESQPYATLNKAVDNTPAGGTVYLKSGTYSPDGINAGTTRLYWTTIAAAPGLGWDDVEISSGRPKTQRLRFKDLSIFTDANNGGAYTVILTGEGGSTVVWLDNVKAWNRMGRYAAGTNVFGNRYGAYITDGMTTQTYNGPGGSLLRNHHIQDIVSDAFGGYGRLVVNCSMDDIDRGPLTSAHPDFYQGYTTAPNMVTDMIMYNVKGTNINAQGLFGSRMLNSAFVNVLLEPTLGTGFVSQFSSINENTMFFHITLVSQSWRWRDSDFVATDIPVYNSIFNDMSLYDGATLSGLDIDSNHFSGTSTMGTNITTGDPMYLDIDAKDFRLDPASPAAGSGIYLQCVPADIDGDLYDAGGRNRGCYAAVADLIPGDADEDGDVDISDFLILKSNYGTAAR